MTLSEASSRTETWELISASCTGACQITVCKNYLFMTFLLILLIWVEVTNLNDHKGQDIKQAISETKRPSGIFSCPLLEVIVTGKYLLGKYISRSGLGLSDEKAAGSAEDCCELESWPESSRPLAPCDACCLGI